MLEYIIANWEEVFGVVALFVLAFDRLAKLTPTRKDDRVVSNIYRLFAVLGLKVKDNEGGE